MIREISDWDNITSAIYKACRGKYKKSPVRKVLLDCDINAFTHNIRNELLNGTAVFGDYNFFYVYEPKKRLICAAPLQDRIKHHAIMNICGQYFDRYQISDSYACRVGKGQYRALERAVGFHRSSRYFVKMDVRKYFDSIDHPVLKILIRRIIKDEKVNALLDKIIDSYSVPADCVELFSRRTGSLTNAGIVRQSDNTGNMKGVPIGNLTSQYFANHYLAYADHYIKQDLKIKKYVRYMDDMVIWGDNKQQFLQHWRDIHAFLKEKLLLDLKDVCHNTTLTGVPFLGYRIMKDRLLLTPNSKKRFRIRMKQYNAKLRDCEWSEAEYMSHVLPAYAFASKADSSGFIFKVAGSPDFVKNTPKH
jgi:retron-type reverse transcriptase